MKRFLAALAALPLIVLLRAAVLRALWGWFVVPLGMPAIGLAHALGLSVIVGYLTYRHDLPTKELTMTAAIAQALGEPLGILLVGWLVQLCM